MSESRDPHSRSTRWNRKERCAQTPLPESAGVARWGRGKSPGNNSWKISRFPFPADAHPSLSPSATACPKSAVCAPPPSFHPLRTTSSPLSTCFYFFCCYFITRPDDKKRSSTPLECSTPLSWELNGTVGRIVKQLRLFKMSLLIFIICSLLSNPSNKMFKRVRKLSNI